MLIPAFSSARVPLRFRLYLAVGISAGLSPLINPELGYNPRAAMELAQVAFRETIVGLMFGFAVRVFFIAIEFIAESISMMIGLSSFVASSVGEMEQVPILSSFISIVFVSLFLISDFHHLVLSSLVATYQFAPIGSSLAMGGSFKDIMETTSIAFFTTMKIGMPFVIISIMTNFGFGLINKVIPQVPAYFLSVPFLIILGVFSLLTVIPVSAFMFFGVLGDWLRHFG